MMLRIVTGGVKLTRRVDFSHVNTTQCRCRKAFTLAELLVVLAVIGIVAMLTIPGLMQSYQKKTWVTQLQKSMSAWNNGMATMLANDGAEELFDTEFGEKAGSNDPGCTNNTAALDVLRQYFKTAKIEVHQMSSAADIHYYRLDGKSGKYSWGYCNNYYFPDGSYISNYWYLNPNSNNFIGNAIIDVNGSKEPNTLGRDVFFFFLKKTGELVPMGSQEYARLYGYSAGAGLWNSTDENLNCNASSSQGYGCAARIIDEGWVMNY